MVIDEKIRKKARIVIRWKPNSSTEPFLTRTISVPKMETCNLALFGLPRHPLYDDNTVVQRLYCDFLALEFTSAKRMDRFADHFEFSLQKEQERLSNIQMAENAAQLYANRPKYATKPTASDRWSVVNPLSTSQTWSTNRSGLVLDDTVVTEKSEES
jgi:hypothetical protein